MEIVLSVLSLTVTKVLQFSGLVNNRNVLKTKKMEEKALEVYGEETGLLLPCNCRVTFTVREVSVLANGEPQTGSRTSNMIRRLLVMQL